MGLLLAIWVFFGLESMVFKVWRSPETPTTYATFGNDGRTLSLILLPKNEAIMLYTKDNSKFIEAALIKMRGTHATHYFWRLWRIKLLSNVDLGLFGFRL